MSRQSLHRRSMWIFFAVLAAAAIGAGFADNLLSNYFKDAYQVSAFQRGMIEFPRELPGILTILLMTVLSSLGDLRIAMIAHGLAAVGLALLGLLTPPFGVMLVVIFFHSIGAHLWYPLQNSIGMSLIDDEANAGRVIGRFNGISIAFSTVASLAVFFGFRSGLFSLITPVKTVFLIAAVCSLATLILLGQLDQTRRLIDPDKQEAADLSIPQVRRPKFIFRREYRYYYILAIVFGVQKQIMVVYAPWVLIDLLGKKADTLALLIMVGSLVGIFFTPAVGRWMDRFGIRAMLFADAFSFIGVYILYGILAAGFATGLFAKDGWALYATYALFIIDRMSMQMGMVRNMYLRSIARSPDDISPTLTTGMSMDHVVSITMATLGGLIWSTIGPQYVFFIAAALSLINYFVAWKVKPGVR